MKGEGRMQEGRREGGEDERASGSSGGSRVSSSSRRKGKEMKRLMHCLCARE